MVGQYRDKKKKGEKREREGEAYTEVYVKSPRQLFRRGPRNMAPNGGHDPQLR